MTMTMLLGELRLLLDVSLSQFPPLHELLKRVGPSLSAEDRTEITTLVTEVENLLRGAKTDAEATIALQTMQALTDQLVSGTGA